MAVGGGEKLKGNRGDECPNPHCWAVKGQLVVMLGIEMPKMVEAEGW